MFDIYQEITDRMIASLESCVIPWKKPWGGTADGAVNWETQKPYSLINQFLLGGYGEWATFKTVQRCGGTVKKGSKAKMVVFWQIIVKEKKDENGRTVRDSNGIPVVVHLPVLKYYNVFNIEKDCEGLTSKQKQGECHFNPIEEAESRMYDYIDRSGVGLRIIKCDEASYSPISDRVQLPLREQFEKNEEFYSTAFHELVHSTGHPKRLNRLSLTPDIESMFGGESYIKEELVAEIGSAAILCKLGIETNDSFKNSSAYIQSWIRQLKNDKRMIVSAASRAEKAMNLILNTEVEEAAKEGAA